MSIQENPIIINVLAFKIWRLINDMRLIQDSYAGRDIPAIAGVYLKRMQVELQKILTQEIPILKEIDQLSPDVRNAAYILIDNSVNILPRPDPVAMATLRTVVPRPGEPVCPGAPRKIRIPPSRGTVRDRQTLVRLAAASSSHATKEMVNPREMKSSRRD